MLFREFDGAERKIAERLIGGHDAGTRRHLAVADQNVREQHGGFLPAERVVLHCVVGRVAEARADGSAHFLVAVLDVNRAVMAGAAQRVEFVGDLVDRLLVDIHDVRFARERVNALALVLGENREGAVDDGYLVFADAHGVRRTGGTVLTRYSWRFGGHARISRAKYLLAKRRYFRMALHGTRCHKRDTTWNAET